MVWRLIISSNELNKCVNNISCDGVQTDAKLLFFFLRRFVFIKKKTHISINGSLLKSVN